MNSADGGRPTGEAAVLDGRPIRLARDRPSSQTPSCHLQP
jgi:hypothetical protein